MAKPGRKRKPGKREANGRLARTAVTFDHGTERTAAKFKTYGTDGSDAIGRAHHHGLLGGDADALKSAARAMYRAYWWRLGVGKVRSTLGNAGSVRGHANDDGQIDAEELERRLEAERRFFAKLAEVDRMGRDYRRAFDELVINPNPDCGPLWLDRIIAAGAGGSEPGAADMAALTKALDALAMVAKG